MRYVIGIDAGGTKTVGLLADETGVLVGEARGRGANLQVDGEDGVEEALLAVWQELGPPETVAATCVGIAGADRPAERRSVRRLLDRLRFGGSVRIVNDAAIALVAGSAAGTGIVVVAGTGSIAYGVDGEGQVARAGGWGYLVGDEGSAFWLGQEALRRGVQAFDGRGPDTVLGERLLLGLGLDDPSELVGWVYRLQSVRFRVAGLVPLIQQAVEEGDQVALDLVDEAAGHLARAARAVRGQLRFEEPFPLVLCGGAFVGCPRLEERVGALADIELARVTPLRSEPAQGAVTLALELLH